ncbi:MAG TPA: hypothetical protein VGA19_02140, partial [Rhodospirillales bacterium]
MPQAVRKRMMPPNAGLRRAVVLPFQAFSSLAMAIMLRRHPSVFERLADLGEPTFLIEPRELPLAFLMYADR